MFIWTTLIGRTVLWFTSVEHHKPHTFSMYVLKTTINQWLPFTFLTQMVYHSTSSQYCSNPQTCVNYFHFSNNWQQNTLSYINVVADIQKTQKWRNLNTYLLQSSRIHIFACDCCKWLKERFCFTERAICTGCFLSPCFTGWCLA